LKVELDLTELNFLKTITEESTIKGKDAQAIGKIITKLNGAFKKEVAKQEKTNGDVGKNS
jgi:hypothetical protein|tara:strand:- start:192 stop:371 length:180 start_codon:yes stop_codon:yes gene_type:complete